jgi:hypothetical protein
MENKEDKTVFDIIERMPKPIRYLLYILIGFFSIKILLEVIKIIF